MHDRSVHEQQRADDSTRVRLVELTSQGWPALDFGGGLAVVATAPTDQSAAAETIARAVIGPRAASIDGTVEIAGRLVLLQSLPSPLLRADAPAVVDRRMLDDLWRELSTTRRGELEAAHAACRFEGHRIDAAVDRVRQRSRRAPAAPALAKPAPEPVVVRDDTARREAERVRARITALLAQYDALGPVVSPEALALAAELDAVATELSGVRDHETEISAAEQRVALARAAATSTNGGIGSGARARIETAHRAVVDAERVVHEAGRKQRSGAEARYAAALEEERAALADAGVESYAAFLMRKVAGTVLGASDVPARATSELAEAEDALEAARRAAGASVPAGSASNRPAADDDVDRRARAARLLGHFPGADAAAELRALRVEDPRASELRSELRSLLRLPSADLDDADPVSAARRSLDEPLPAVEMIEQRRAAEPQPATAPVAPAPVVPAPVADASPELDALIGRRDALARTLAELEQQIETFDRHQGAEFVAVDGIAATSVLTALLERYRTAQLLAGRLPLVIAGAFDDLAPATADAVVAALAAIDDIQVIVVTAQHRLVVALTAAGAARVEWPTELEPVGVVAPADPRPAPQVSPPPAPAATPAPPPAAPAPPSPAAPPSPPRAADRFAEMVDTRTARCARHDDVAEAAQCGHCGRSCCIDCLVYTTADNSVWCVECAETLQARNLRLLRRRGA